ncbi:hypothetical protein TSTA_009200 [Talaromyces stipitatus ATCC 10500]|uniref:Extracellular membrane protein CFEM domain-containing protein n=1 Tax=Talaromyces stipitatus (strain ATCC 10500 / CBS 375.48 / QM 6759 / NRRL 1006) TaxID=441959 RepID=B8MFS8_TALSN|nr:uncharacterized protein TSTA_009200 [Talaromyces stipitatus ATCC 10500]EED15795.1 hypothetical protein TSTA_009200 [Talaromyces stipitatus ATCC 10500]
MRVWLKMRVPLLLRATILTSILKVRAQNITTPDPRDCVDLAEFTSCLKSANTAVVQCTSRPNSSVDACEVQELVVVAGTRCIPTRTNISRLNIFSQLIKITFKVHHSMLHLPTHLIAALAT